MHEITKVNTVEVRGGYRPKETTQESSPLFRWPPNVLGLLKWLFGFPGFLWPWQIFFLGVAFVFWHFLIPGINTVKNLSLTWIALLLAQNLTLLIVFVGAWHVFLYVHKTQGTQYKYNSRWLAVGNPTFLFDNQLWDNVFWNICSAVPIWTGYEALTLWLQANKVVPTVSWHAHPIYGASVLLLTQFWLEIHFYVFHRAIHWQPLYNLVHSIHHKNINFGPWSGLAMHPIEHLLLFSGIMIFWIIPVNPLNCLYLLVLYALGPSLDHQGFDRVRLSSRLTLNADHWMHYLHHRYVTVNFGGVSVPLDRWFGTFHDGSDEAQEMTKRRARVRIARSRGK
jgi:sterol desaturase/sphingolipid hydroxylase (fatty acid hydroxylase superfamily)